MTELAVDLGMGGHPLSRLRRQLPPEGDPGPLRGGLSCRRRRHPPRRGGLAPPGGRRRAGR